MKTSSLLASIEALLFMSGEALSLEKMATLLRVEVGEIERAIRGLSLRYKDNPDSALQIILKENEALLVTKGEVASIVEMLTKSAMQESLSKAALEVLAIIAYRNPITRSEIEAIRGVNCNFTLRNLLLRDLITRTGNPDDSREYIYRITFRLLQQMGVQSINELPNFHELSKDARLDFTGEVKPTGTI